MRNASAGSFATSMILAALAFAADGAKPDGRAESSDWLDALTWLFILGAFAFFALSIMLGTLFLLRWGWRYFHTIDISAGQWGCRYWPLQRRLQVTGVAITTRDWAGEVSATCDVLIANEAVQFAAVAQGARVLKFPQQSVNLARHPEEGDLATVTVKSNPPWWRGWSGELSQNVLIGISDQRSDDQKRSDALLERV